MVSAMHRKMFNTVWRGIKRSKRPSTNSNSTGLRADCDDERVQVQLQEDRSSTHIVTTQQTHHDPSLGTGEKRSGRGVHP